MKKKIVLIIIAILLIVAIAATVIVIVINNNKSPFGSKWGETYYAYLKDIINEEDSKVLESEYGIPTNMEDAKIQFCKEENEVDPQMVLTYKTGDNTAVNLYQINEDGNIDKKCYTNKANIKYLYDLETQTYGWFVCETEEDNKVYNSISHNENENKEIKLEEKETTVTLDDNKNVTITEFDKKFIDPNAKELVYFDFDLDMDKKDLENSIKESVEDFKENKDLISKEEKEKVSNREQEIKELKIKLEELIEKNKNIAGTWAINANVKSNTNEIVGLTTLFGSSLKFSSNELVLKEDGTFTFYLGETYNTTGKYKYENNIVSVYDIKDSGKTNPEELKKIENELKFEYIKYNSHEFLKFEVQNIIESETYIFFQKKTNSNQVTMTDPVPDVKYKTINKTAETPKENTSTASSQNQEKAPSTNNQTNTPSVNKQQANQNESSIKVGGYTLKYGTYRGTVYQYDMDGTKSSTITIKLNPDGTYTYQSTDQSIAKSHSGKFVAGENSGFQAITFSNGEFLAVYENNAMSSVAGGAVKYTYQGK